jgi:predicted transcriptional regulator
MKTKEAIGALGALAQDTRLGIYRLLVQKGPEGLSAGAIAQKLEVPASSLSFHLHHLMHAGLINQARESRQLFYAANFDQMNALVGYLTENCCGLGAAACAPTCKVTPEEGVTREASPRARRR